MILNVGIAALLGLVPVIGDLFDVVSKAHERNMALLEAHAFEHRAPAAGGWLIVGAAVVLLVAMAVLPALAVAWVVVALFGRN